MSAAVYRYKKAILRKKRALKVYLSLHVNFHLSTDPTFATDPPFVLNTEPVEILESTIINQTLDNIYDTLIKAIDDFELRGSGWV